MITGFNLRINGSTEIDVGYVFSYLLTGLTPATTYSVEIQSYDENGVESAWSTAVVAETLSPSMLIDSDGNALTDSGGNALIIYA